jgi:hypothetical protein
MDETIFEYKPEESSLDKEVKQNKRAISMLRFEDRVKSKK